MDGFVHVQGEVVNLTQNVENVPQTAETVAI